MRQFVRVAVDSNTNQSVVGWNETINHALLWEYDGSSWSATDLDSLQNVEDLVLKEAHDLNDDDWIVCYGRVLLPGDDEYSVYLLTPYEACRADLDGDDDVDFDDFTLLLANFDDECPPAEFCIADLDANGIVDFDDFTLLLAAWGDCPTGVGSLLEDMIAAGLNQDDYDDYLDIMENGTQTQKDCWTAWLDHYLNCTSNCGTGHGTCPDPFLTN